MGNPVKIYLERFDLKSEIENWKFLWKFKWTFEIHEIAMEIQLSFQGISVNISMKHQWKSIRNPVEISMKYQWKFRWNAKRNKFEIYIVKIPMKYQWKCIGKVEF